jgi:hypothetical protein
MAYVDDSGITQLDRITIAAVVRAAGWGLLSAAEARLLIDRLRTHPTTPPSPTQYSSRSGVGGRPGSSVPVSPEGTVR